MGYLILGSLFFGSYYLGYLFRMVSEFPENPRLGGFMGSFKGYFKGFFRVYLNPEEPTFLRTYIRKS